MTVKTSDLFLTATLFTSACIASISSSIINAFYPYQAVELGLNRMQVGVAFAMQPFGKFIFENFFKNVVFERRKYSIMIGFCFSFTSLLLFAFCEELVQKNQFFALSIASRFLLGIVIILMLLAI